MRRLKQIEETQKMISDALLRLLTDKSMEEISVSEIALEAGIGRNTFYNHFQRKEEILDCIMHRILEEVKEELTKKGNPSIRDFLLWRFTFIKDNPLMTVFQKHNDIEVLLLRFRMSNATTFNLSTQTDHYFSDFFQGGLDYVTSKWIISGMKESPEEMANKVISFTRST